MFLLVSYDIPDDGRRLAIAKTLLDYGPRVQYSVFECEVNETAHAQLLDRLSSLVVEGQDSVRVYELCRACVGKCVCLGKGEITRDRDVYIV